MAFMAFDIGILKVSTLNLESETAPSTIKPGAVNNIR